MSLLSGCASQSFNYVPSNTGAGTTTPKDSLSAIFPEPADSPKGQVRVRSLGVVDLRAKGDRTRIPALHIRMNIVNTDAPAAWTLVIQEQSLAFANQAEEHPTYANSSAATMPNLEVKPGETHAVDLYFALPNKSTAPKDIPEFDLKWVLHTGNQSLQGSTTFERAFQAVPPSTYAEPYPVGYGPYWWDTWSAPGIYVAPSIRVRH